MKCDSKSQTQHRDSRALSTQVPSPCTLGHYNYQWQMLRRTLFSMVRHVLHKVPETHWIAPPEDKAHLAEGRGRKGGEIREGRGNGVERGERGYWVGGEREWRGGDSGKTQDSSDFSFIVNFFVPSAHCMHNAHIGDVPHAYADNSILCTCALSQIGRRHRCFSLVWCLEECTGFHTILQSPPWVRKKGEDKGTKGQTAP